MFVARAYVSLHVCVCVCVCVHVYACLSKTDDIFATPTLTVDSFVFTRARANVRLAVLLTYAAVLAWTRPAVIGVYNRRKHTLSVCNAGAPSLIIHGPAGVAYLSNIEACFSLAPRR